MVGGGYYVFASTYTSGACIEWLRDLLGATDDPISYEDLIAGAERVPAGSLGVLFLPHLRLASPPYDDPRSRGALVGLTMDTNRNAITRAVFEGLALESRNLLEPLLTYPQVTSPQSVVAIGGGTRNPLLMNIKASVSNLTYQIVKADEATALGAALLGGLGAGVYEDVDDAVGAMRYGQQAIAPEPADVPVYESIYYEVYRRFYPSVAPLSQTISDLQATTAVSQDDA